MAKYDVNGDSVVTKAEFDSRQESLANEEILEEFDEAAESDDETSPANSIGKFVEIQKSFSTPGAAATPARASLVISDFQTAYSVDAAIKTRSDSINPKFELGGYGIKFSPSLLVEAHVRIHHGLLPKFYYILHANLIAGLPGRRDQTCFTRTKGRFSSTFTD